MKRKALLVAAIFAASFVAESVLERQHLVDSIGWWYTALVAAIYTLVLVGGWLLFRVTIRFARTPKP